MILKKTIIHVNNSVQFNVIKSQRLQKWMCIYDKNIDSK